MLIRYKGVVSPTGRPKVTGCSSCGSARVGKTPRGFANPYTYYYDSKPYTFYLGKDVLVPAELGEILLRKYSYVNGMKVEAFEEVI